MEQPNLAEISRRSGKSVATVSKVLRGCPGVTWETREAVLRAADGLSAPNRGREGAVSVILPDNPKYFWSQARAAVAEEGETLTGASVALRVYSQIEGAGGVEVVERYLREAETARVIVLAARPDESLQRTLRSLAEGRLILQLCEYVDVPNTFFVGSDGEADGRMLALSIPASERPLRIGVLRGEDSALPNARTRGFLRSLPEVVELLPVECPAPSELFSSHLARAIDALGVPLDYLFCNDGITTAACEAIHKLRDRMQTRLLGFELPGSAKKHLAAGRIAALAVQSPGEQMRMALRLGAQYLGEGRFPDRKRICLPSERRRAERPCAHHLRPHHGAGLQGIQCTAHSGHRRCEPAPHLRRYH